MTNSRNSTFRLKFVQAWADRDGRAHYYFRRTGYPLIRLPGLIGSGEFMAAYAAALGSDPEPIGASKRSPAGSVSAAIAGYYSAPAFKGLAPSSQAVRRFVLEAFRREHGDKQIAAMQRRHLAALLDPMTPAAARNWLKAIKALTAHCIDIEMLKDDPTLGIKLRRIGGDGHHTWTEDEIAKFQASYAIGTRERLAFALGLYTGQRRGDVIRMGRQHIRDGVLHVRQEKTGAALAIPVHPELQAVLAGAASDRLTFLTTQYRRPFAGKSFTQWFAKACSRAGLSSECTFHGLRKAACRRLAEAGCTVHEIAAIKSEVIANRLFGSMARPWPSAKCAIKPRRSITRERRRSTPAQVLISDTRTWAECLWLHNTRKT